jgi:GNAT superfamily N-acetyltransferase
MNPRRRLRRNVVRRSNVSVGNDDDTHDHLDRCPGTHIRRGILGPLVRFNETRAGAEKFHLLVIVLSHPETGEVLGGLWGETIYSHLHVDLLFVPEELRGTGIGRRLMGDAETEAIRRGCRGAWLDTFSFQARGFYERLGYAVFGTIDDCPPGHHRFFLKKEFPAR